MASTVFDSAIFGGMFSTDEMRSIFSDEALLRRYVEAEVALAQAEADCALLPQEAARKIAAAADKITFDLQQLGKETEIVGYPILPLVHQLASEAGEAGRFVHWGATTQDIMDTATILQVRDAVILIERDLHEVRTTLARLADQHRDTVMAGRTHLQHALPITFGYKAAIWLSSIDRHIERLRQAKPRVLVGEFSGAAGTLASLKHKGLEVQARFCELLGLSQPTITWHVARDGLAEIVSLLGLITSTLGKIATDVMIMMSTEFGEVSEPFVRGRGASSTMPQKRNPISSEIMLAAAKAVRQHVATMLDASIHDFERATGPWHLEWISLSESFQLSAASLSNAKYMLNGLVVNEARMRDNLNLTKGLIVAEAVMMAAAGALGRQHAHDLVYDVCKSAIESGRSLEQGLLQTPDIVKAVGGADAVAKLCDPANYLGLASEMIDRTLAISQKINQRG